MTDNLTGRVASVATLPLVGFLASDAPVGTTVLDLVEASDFDANGGSAVLSGGNPAGDTLTESVTFLSADDDMATVTLAAPTTIAFYEGDQVALWDAVEGKPVVETVAQVAMTGDVANVDTVEATVDHSLIPYLPEGIREPGAEEAVSLQWRGSTLFVQDILGRLPVMDGGMIDPDTIPSGGGPEPETPVTPSAPAVQGGIGSLLIRWTPIVHANPVVYEVHVADGNPFMPGPTTLVGEISGSQLTVRSLPVPNSETGEPTTALSYAKIYYAAIIAKDSVDESYRSGLSAVGSGFPVQATGGDLAADSVTATNVVAGSISGTELAGEILLGSTIKTAEAGQRVQMDSDGIRLFSPAEEVRVSLPTAPGESPSFRGRVEADGLTVRQGASFYSPDNEFARDSRIRLAEQVAGPIAAPTPEFFYDRFFLVREARSGPLGTFALDPSQITSVGYNHNGNTVSVVQQRPGGARVWQYTLLGTIAERIHVDYVNWIITGYFIRPSGHSVWIAKWAATQRWYYQDDEISPSALREYSSGYTDTNAMLSWDGSNAVIAETMGGAGATTRWRTVDNTPGPLSYTTVTSSGIGAPDRQPVFSYKGNADFGALKHVIAYADNFQIRVFSNTGAYQSQFNWPSPVSKVGGFYHPSSGRFFSMGSDGYLYLHSALTWTDPALDTWHVGQSFLDTNTAGGTHESNLGAIASFAMRKRANVRFTLADVPYGGNPDDPNAWAVYAKRGTAPATNLSDMRRQGVGLPAEKTFVMTAEPLTTGQAARVTGDFPGASPARLVSQRTMPSSVDPVLEIRGDGAGRWGTLEVSTAGRLAIKGETLVLSLGTNVSVLNGQPPFVEYVGGTVYLGGRCSWTGSTGTVVDGVGNNKQLTGDPIPEYMRPVQANQDVGVLGNSATGFARIWVTSAGHIFARVLGGGTTQAAFLGGSYRAAL